MRLDKIGTIQNDGNNRYPRTSAKLNFPNIVTVLYMFEVFSFCKILNTAFFSVTKKTTIDSEFFFNLGPDIIGR